MLLASHTAVFCPETRGVAVRGSGPAALAGEASDGEWLRNLTPSAEWQASPCLRDRHPLSDEPMKRFLNMLSELNPMLNETVSHFLPPTRDIYGQETFGGSTTHRARIARSPGVLVGPASGTGTTNAAATIWVINHPRLIEIGSHWLLPGDEIDDPEDPYANALKAIRVELRTVGRVSLHKVSLT